MFPRYFTNFLPAASGSTPSTIRIEAPDCEFYRLQSIPFGIQIAINGGPKIPAEFIPAFQIKDGDPKIQLIELVNTTATVMRYQLIAGRGTLPALPAVDAKEPKTVSLGTGKTSLAAAESYDFPPALDGVRIQRKAVVVTNYDLSVNVLVADSTGATVATVFPLQCVTLPISETCKVINASGGAAVSVAIAGIYWTL